MRPRRARVPAGVRRGGQFAAHAHADPAVDLGRRTGSEDASRATVPASAPADGSAAPMCQVRAALAAAGSVRDQHPDAATIDLDQDGDRCVPVAVRDRFGDTLPTTMRPGAPWERFVDLRVAAGHIAALRPDQLVDVGWVRAAPDYRGVRWMLDVDQVLATTPF